MRSRHVSFIVDSEDGHINSTLGMAMALMRHGFRVSYAVNERMAVRVAAVGAETNIYTPLDHRTHFLAGLEGAEHSEGLEALRSAGVGSAYEDFLRKLVETSVPQLKNIYAQDRPDLVIYDDSNPAGHALAIELGIPNVEQSNVEVFTTGGWREKYNKDLVIISIPTFLQPNLNKLDDRFKFVGPLFPDIYTRHTAQSSKSGKTILVSGPTAGFASIDRFKLAIAAFEETDCEVILSIGERLDPQQLGRIPKNFEIDRRSSHLDMLQRVSLFVCHGGMTSSLEALYRGVPLLVVPCGPPYERIARLITDLGLGTCLPKSESSKDRLRHTAQNMLRDEVVHCRVRQAQKAILEDYSPEKFVQVIEAFLSRKC